MTEASRSLDVGETGLRRWVDQLKAERGDITPVSKALTPDQQPIQKLEARVNRLKREKIILKKAWYGIPAALLMSDEWNRTN
jgi:transposase